MQIGTAGSGIAYAPNPVQLQQAIAPIAEAGTNDLQSPETQRVSQTAATDTRQQAAPSNNEGRGQLVDIYA